MAPKRRSSKKTAAKASSSKRRCTEEDDEISALTTNTNDFNVDNNDDELPTPSQLSEVLCMIVSTRYSRDEALGALDRLIQWAEEKNPEFLETFNTYGGVVKVIDFLETTMLDMNCVGNIRMECIEKAAHVLKLVCSLRHDGSNKEIVTKIATCVMNYNGIDTLINASEEYSGGDDLPQLQALGSVWAALASLSCHTGAMKNVINKDKANILFDTGIDILFHLKSNDNLVVVSCVLANVFVTLNNIVRYQYVEKKKIQDTTILSKCLDVFRKENGMWGGRSEPETKNAITFISCCQYTKLLDRDVDYEMLLPFLAMCLKKFGSNKQILLNILHLIDRACDSSNNVGGVNDTKIIIERSGIVGPLGVLLASNDINKDQILEVREVLAKIVTP